MNTPKIRFKGFKDDWEQRKASELCSISTGKSNTQDKIDDGEYPFYVRSPIIERSNKYLYDEEAVLTVGDGVGTGKVFHYVNGKYDLHQRVYRMYGFKENVDAKYFYYFFSKNFYQRVMAMTAKTSVDSVRLEMIADMNFNIPSYEEQQKIGQYFSDLDNLITLHQRKCDETKELKKFMLQKLFPKNGQKNPEIRFEGFTDDWEQRKASELCSISTGKSNTQDKIDDGEYPFYVRSPIIERSNKYLYDEEAVLTVGDGVGTGKVFHYVNGKYDLHQRVYRMYGFKENVDAKYFYYFFSKNFYQRVMAMTAKTSVDSVRLEMIADMNFNIPSYEEQQKIGQYFSDLDNLITLHQRKCDETKELKKFMLQKLFPKNGQKNPEIRFEGFTDDWEQRKLGDVAEFLDTMRKPLEGARRIPGPYPYYGASGIVDYVDGYLFNEELVLLSEDGANITDRNYPVCFLASGKYWVNNHAHVLRLKDGNENNFICTSLERKDYKQYNSGMAMPKLNQEVCRRIPIGCPSFNEQKKIGDYFRNLDHLITLHQRKCEKLKELKKYMLQNMFV